MNVPDIVKHFRAKGLTYCGRPGKLETLHRLAAQVEAADVAGIFLEGGVAMGGSASVLARTKRPDRELRLFDVFALLPPPSAEDGDKAQIVYDAFKHGRATTATDVNYLRHAEDLLSFTIENMREVGIEPARDNVTFVKGLYEDTLILEEPVAFAHIDCDWFESVNTCIERIADFVSPHGVILFDDYHSFEGCQRAVDAWLERDTRFQIIHQEWTLAVARKP